MHNSFKVPVLNNALAIFFSLLSIGCLIAGLVTGAKAAIGESFLYSNFIVKLFPYSDAIFGIDIFRFLLRIITGLLPAFIAMAFFQLIIIFLIKGKSSASKEFSLMCRGFIYQLRHPFSNPRSYPPKKGEDL